METISRSDSLVLSLCIPTYNRLPLLTEALSAVIDQIDDKIAPVVEILISNNASTDKTEEYVKELISTHPYLQIIYFCNKENIGADANIYQVTRQAKGEWIYILSDDDILLPGGLAKLLELIGNYPNFDAFCLNIYGFEGNPYIQAKPVFDVSEDRIITNKDDSFIFLGVWITFISAMAFRKTVIEKHDHHDKIGTSLRHCYISLDALVSSNGLYVAKDNFLAMRGNNTGGFNLFEVFVKNFGDVLNYAKSIGYSKSVTDKILVKHAFYLLVPFIRAMKLQSIADRKYDVNYKQAISFVRSTYSGSILLRLTGSMLILLILLPSKILSYLPTLYKLKYK
jgi:abequosyltransferase